MPLVQPVVQQEQTVAPMPVEKKNDNSSLIKTVIIVIVSLVAVTFIGLFVWMLVQYNDVSTDVEGQIATAVAAAKIEQAMEDEATFAEREKNPYKSFSGPVDYGQLTFKYPKTWSVYIASDASKGGDFEAYFNPVEVNPVSNTTVNALRVKILDKDFETVVAEYQRAMSQKDSNLSMTTITVNGTTANRYSGTIPSTDLNGYIVIFRIRDKTVVLRTDSVLFEEDFNQLIDTISFNA